MTTPRNSARIHQTLTVWLVMIAAAQLLATAAMWSGIRFAPSIAASVLIVFGPWLIFSQHQTIRATRLSFLRAVRPKRRWVQFSLRSLLILTFMSASFAAGWAARSREAEEAHLRARVNALHAEDLGKALRAAEKDLIDLKVSFGIDPATKLSTILRERSGVTTESSPGR